MNYLHSRIVRSTLTSALVLGLGIAPVHAQTASPSLTTVAERSGFLKTGRYEEVIELCARFEQRYPDAMRCEEFGATPEGRPMKLLVATRTGAFTPEQVRASGIPVTLIQGGIHAGEIDGKDAGFLALRQILDGEVGAGSLEKQVLLFVPVLNIDGHERFGAWNRPNQRGPQEMGWRTTARNDNLNRDYVKADTPEMQAMLGVIRVWDPLVHVDLHVTDGAKFEHDVSIQVEPAHVGDEELRKVGSALRDGTVARLARQGSLPVPFFPSFVEADNPASGFEIAVRPPRYSHGYFHLRNRVAMLVETHSWKDYATRTRVTRNAIVDVLEQVAENGRQWRQEAMAADRRAEQLAGKTVALDYKLGSAVRMIVFRGYAYTRTRSEVSGGLMTRYDETKPQVWTVPLKYDVQPATVAIAPQGGYLVPAAQAAWVAEKLDQHGIEYRRLPSSIPQAQVEAFRATTVQFAAQPSEGRQRTTLQGQWKAEAQDLAAGALFVPIAQAKARLAMAILEPQAPDSLAAWGEFNNAFEPKEYMEDYVAEDVAREMLRDPHVQAEFDAKLKGDAGFASSPKARLEFFYRRHSSWDSHYNLYPVFRIAWIPR